jgi:DNA-3-methyladenine glycosylase I
MTAAPHAARERLKRCPWVGIANEEYTRYHDEEWGVPLLGDDALFEKLVLEGFQSGLSWLTILKKRENFRSAFHGFEAERIARYRTKDVERLMQDAGIVRNRAKIEATIANANAVLKLRKRTSLKDFLWSFLDKGAIQNRYRSMGEIPAQTDVSQRIAKGLKAEGFRFVGPTTVYAFMQSAGMVNDHLVGCHRHAACARLQRAKVKPANAYSQAS